MWNKALKNCSFYALHRPTSLNSYLVMGLGGGAMGWVLHSTVVC